MRRLPSGEYETLVHDPRLLWPDTMSVATDRYLYVTANQLYRQAKSCDGEDRRRSRTPCSGSGSTQARSCSGGERTVSAPVSAPRMTTATPTTASAPPITTGGSPARRGSQPRITATTGLT